jgi:hypothetical protein
MIRKHKNLRYLPQLAACALLAVATVPEARAALVSPSVQENLTWALPISHHQGRVAVTGLFKEHTLYFNLPLSAYISQFCGPTKHKYQKQCTIPQPSGGIESCGGCTNPSKSVAEAVCNVVCTAYHCVSKSKFGCCSNCIQVNAPCLGCDATAGCGTTKVPIS